jgi:hypothetical protein
MISYSESALVHSNPSEIQGELGPHLLVVHIVYSLKGVGWDIDTINEIGIFFVMP